MIFFYYLFLVPLYWNSYKGLCLNWYSYTRTLQNCVNSSPLAANTTSFSQSQTGSAFLLFGLLDPGSCVAHERLTGLVYSSYLHKVISRSVFCQWLQLLNACMPFISFYVIIKLSFEICDFWFLLEEFVCLIMPAHVMI